MIQQRPIAIVLTVAAFLLIPLIAMQFTDEVNWSLLDFIIAGGLLLGAGFACELIWRTVTKKQHRMAICGIIILALVLFWIELAVGIFNSPLAGS